MQTQLKSHQNLYESLKSEIMTSIKTKPEDSAINAQNLALAKDINEPAINLLNSKIEALKSKIELLKQDSFELRVECSVFEDRHKALTLDLRKMSERRNELINRLEQLCESE